MSTGTKNTLDAGQGIEGEETNPYQEEGSAMNDTALLSVLAFVTALAGIAATPKEVLDNSGYTLGCAMHAAALAGLDPKMDYRKAPLIPIDVLPDIRRRILDERAALAAMDRVELDDELDVEGEDAVTGLCTIVGFLSRPDRIDPPEVLVEDIPTLVDQLLRIYRDATVNEAWKLTRDEDLIRAAADVREVLQ